MGKHILQRGSVFDTAKTQLQAGIDELNTELDKAGFPKAQIAYFNSGNEVEAIGSPTPRKVRKWDYRVTCHIPTIKGWTIFGQLSKNNGKSNFVRNFSKDMSVDFDGYRSCSLDCDHCDTKRDRKSVILIRKDSETKMIGEDCLEDFLGFRPTKALKALDAYSNFQRMAWKISGKKGLTSKIGDTTNLDLKDFLKHVLCAVDKQGYVTRNEGSQTTGRTATLCYLSGPRSAYTGNRFGPIWGDVDAYYQAYEDNDAPAEELIAWAKSQGNSKNDYLRNIAKIADEGWATVKNANMAASIYHAHQSRSYMVSNSTDKKHRDSESQPRNVDIHAKCIYAKPLSGTPRQTVMHKLATKNGDEITYFSDHREMTPGDIYHIKGIIAQNQNGKSNSSWKLTEISELRRSSAEYDSNTTIIKPTSEISP